MPWPTLLLALGTVPAAGDLSRLPPNTWVEIQYATEQPADPAEKGAFARQLWNKLVYDPDGRRVLFYDRWVDKKHGGMTIYGNCLFAFDPAAARLRPVKIDNWTRTDTPDGGYRTRALPANDAEPTPCPRHVYHAFEYVPEAKAIFLCNGANQTAVNKDGKLVYHSLCDGIWRLDLRTNRWSRIVTEQCPPNTLEDAMAYCPDTHSLVYAGANRQLWLFDLKKGQWRKARSSPPARPAMGQTIFHDPTRQRMLVLGGGRLPDSWAKGKAEGFRELYAFDPKAEAVTRLADAPTACYQSHLAFDARHRLFFTVAVFPGGGQPSGMFAYDPAKDAWRAVKPANAIPPHHNWFGWMQLCYDAHDDCLIGKVNERFFAFRYGPGN